MSWGGFFSEFIVNLFYRSTFWFSALFLYNLVEVIKILMKAINFLHPNLPKLILFVLLMLMSMFVVVRRDATSKVSWEQVRGTPFSYLVLTEYRGPCSPQNTFCVKINFQRIYSKNLLVDILFWYVISCGIILPYDKLVKQFRGRKSI